MTTTKAVIDSEAAMAKADAAFERATAPARKKLESTTEAAWATYYQETDAARTKLRAAVAKAEKARVSTGKEK